MRTCYQYKNLSDKAKDNASKLYTDELLTQWLYNEDGTKFHHSKVVQL